MTKGEEGGPGVGVFTGRRGKWRRSLLRMWEPSSSKMHSSSKSVWRHWTVRAASKFLRESSKLRVRSIHFQILEQRSGARPKPVKERSGSTGAEPITVLGQSSALSGIGFHMEGVSYVAMRRKEAGGIENTLLLLLIFVGTNP